MIDSGDTGMLPVKPTSDSTHPRRKMVWLFLGHIVVGLIGAVVAWFAGSSPTVRGWAFLGIVLGQTSLLGIWLSLGTNRWWIRLIGVVGGISYLFPLLGLGIHEFNLASLFVVLIATTFVALVLLFVRFFRVVIHLDSRPVASAIRIQFSTRHLMILTFVIASLIAIVRSVGPFLPHGTLEFELLILAPNDHVTLVAVFRLPPLCRCHPACSWSSPRSFCNASRSAINDVATRWPSMGEIPPVDVERTAYGQIDRQELWKNFQKRLIAVVPAKLAKLA